MDDDGVGALFGFQVVALGETDADGVFRLEEAKDFLLVFEVGAGGVAEGVPGAAVLLVDEVADRAGILAGDA